MRTKGLSQVLAYAAHQRKAGLLRLHHDIEQHHRDVGVHREQAARLGGAVRAQEFQAAIGKLEVAEDEAGDVMHLRLVIDDEDLPRRLDPVLLGRREVKMVVLPAHVPPPCASGSVLRPERVGTGPFARGKQRRPDGRKGQDLPWNSSRPISMRLISLVPAPIS